MYDQIQNIIEADQEMFELADGVGNTSKNYNFLAHIYLMST